MSAIREPAAEAETLPDLRGCVALAEGFWYQVHHDLSSTYRLHCRRTALWVLREPGFVTWCLLTGAEPTAVRAALRARYPQAFALVGVTA